MADTLPYAQQSFFSRQLKPRLADFGIGAGIGSVLGLGRAALTADEDEKTRFPQHALIGAGLGGLAGLGTGEVVNKLNINALIDGLTQKARKDAGKLMINPDKLRSKFEDRYSPRRHSLLDWAAPLFKQGSVPGAGPTAFNPDTTVSNATAAPAAPPTSPSRAGGTSGLINALLGAGAGGLLGAGAGYLTSKDDEEDVSGLPGAAAWGAAGAGLGGMGAYGLGKYLNRGGGDNNLVQHLLNAASARGNG